MISVLGGGKRMNRANLDGIILSITGGTGSFGKTMLAHALNTGVKEIRLISRDEEKQDSLRRITKDERVKYFVCDVRELRDVTRALDGSDLLFHAAALKQVPTGEFFPMQVVKTNILGSNNVFSAAIQCEIPKVICLSTDKAVQPINAMGMSKALMEKIATSYAREGQSKNTNISVTRYGNVICSRGSVIPRFIDQLASNHPITITHAEMTRFLMSLQDAISLVLYAFAHSKPGDIFVQKAPGARVIDIASAIAKILNVPQPNISTIGKRHGEKMDETLLTEEEREVSSEVDNFFRVPLDQRTLNYETYFTVGSGKVEQPVAFTSGNTYRLSVDEIAQILMENREMQEILKGLKK